MLQSRQRTQAPRAVGDTSVAVRFAQDGQDAPPLPGAIAYGSGASGTGSQIKFVSQRLAFWPR